VSIYFKFYQHKLYKLEAIYFIYSHNVVRSKKVLVANTSRPITVEE